MINIKLKEVAKSKGYTLTNIAKSTGISMNTLSVLGRNESRGIQFDTLEKICKFLECSPNDLLEIAEEEYIINFPAYQKTKNWIYGLVVKKSVVEKARSKNTMYNADENELPIFIYCVTPPPNTSTVQLFAGLPLDNSFFSGIEMKNNSKIDKRYSKNKLKKFIKSLSDRQRESLCRQSASIFIKSYWNGDLPSRIFVAYNEGMDEGESAKIYPYKVEKNKKLTEIHFKNDLGIAPSH